jgi:hypothetical protein
MMLYIKHKKSRENSLFVNEFTYISYCNIGKKKRNETDRNETKRNVTKKNEKFNKA